MCGIMGYVGERSAVPILLKGLKRLEYRGYDSAGVAYLKGKSIEIIKSEGKLQNVEKLVDGSGEKSFCGIGHTRWATHGKPTTQNAHPHRTGPITLVHNGIIENYLEVKERMVGSGYSPASETDSELYGFLVLEELKKGASFVEAARKAFGQLEGACSVVVMSEDEPGVIVGIRNGSPLVAATDPEGGGLLASDAQPILEYNQDVNFLENGDMAVVTAEGVKFYDYKSGKPIQRESTRLDWSPEKMDKQGHPHYMRKEIFEQPLSMVDTLNGLLDRAHTDPFPIAQQPATQLIHQAKNLVIVACGTAWHSALLGKYWLERWAKLPVNVELASEFRYRSPVLTPGTLVVGVSQSGETADTLSVIREMKERGIPTLAITNTRGSTLSRECDATFFTSAGPEIGVAATKTFTVQMLTMFLMAGSLGMKRGHESQTMRKLFDQTIRLPHLLETALTEDSPLLIRIQEVAEQVHEAKGFFFIGRGYNFPLALEGALKLKEIAYIPAEGYAGGELKHGPIAMIEKNMVVVVISPNDSWYDKTISNLQEVKARGATIVGVGNPGNRDFEAQCDHWIPISHEKVYDSLYPFLVAPVLQLLSYEIALLRGTDVDQPRNLAKSVTVE